MQDTIVIIDDNAPNLNVLQTALEKLGYSVISVKQTSKIKAIIEETPRIDLILLDLEMPSTSGYNVLAELREAGIEAPIVAHTVHVDQLSRIQSAGFNGLLPKPLNLATLEAFISQTMNGQRIWSY